MEEKIYAFLLSINFRQLFIKMIIVQNNEFRYASRLCEIAIDSEEYAESMFIKITLEIIVDYRFSYSGAQNWWFYEAFQ